mmetsp:Transcript_40924/g.85978  ORF Transcript_40924/g.85978 Transcript_40924/m.85978 type:complete len:223 (-) Transcript_40924:1092-1760(-)
MKLNTKSPVREWKVHLRTLFFAAVAYIIIAFHSKTVCHAFTLPASQTVAHYKPTKIHREHKNDYVRLTVFRELVLDDEEDLRTDIAVIKKADGLDNFLNQDDRLCVIKFFAPYCKACRAFGVKFRKLAIEKGDRLNSAGEAVHFGDARFGEIDYASNVKLCKDLGVKKFPTVLIFQGGDSGNDAGSDSVNLSARLLSEIVCKQTAIDNIVGEMDRLMSPSER